jgi:tripartite-type tricarboxylate transporter receptor subunit TctC
VVATAQAFAQPWPNRPMTMVVPFAAGGASDVIARIVADGLRTELGQTVVVENIGGAGGMVGANRVANASPDGYQMVLGNVGTHAQNQTFTSRSTTLQAISSQWRWVTVSRWSCHAQGFPGRQSAGFIAHAKANQRKYGTAPPAPAGRTTLPALLNSASVSTSPRSIERLPGGLGHAGGATDYQCPSAPARCRRSRARC